MPSRTRPANLLASAALTVILALSAGGCSNIGAREATGSVNAADTTSPGSDESRRSLETLGARYRQNPNDADVAIAYARALRATDQRAQAVAVLEQASIRNPRNMALLGAYGRGTAFKRALAWLARTPAVRELITARFPLPRIADAFAHATAGHGIKTVVGTE